MHRVLVLGAGKIGRAIAMFLHSAGAFDVLVADTEIAALKKLRSMVPVDTVIAEAGNPGQLRSLMQNRDTVISALVFTAGSGTQLPHNSLSGTLRTDEFSAE